MRDNLIFLIIFALVPFSIKRPVIGIMAYTWISLMNPHRLTYGAAYGFPFAALIAGATMLGILVSKEPRRLPVNGTSILLFVFLAWINVTVFFALEPDLAWKEWDRVMKTLFATSLAIWLIREEKDIKIFAAVVALSIGFYGVKGGLFTIITAGGSRVVGPEDSYIADNNTLALALVASTPIIWYLRTIVNHKLLRLGLSGAAFLTLVGAVGTYSRGALLAGSAMMFFLWLKSDQKMRSALALMLVVPVVFMVMPEQWFSRMESIDDYKQDASAMGRINAWMFAINVAKDNFLGGGFRVFTPNIFRMYAPDPLDYHVAHSIYFQVLGEHGIVGLVLYVLLMISTWRTAQRVLRACRGKPELKWAFDLASMLQVSLIGFAVAGAFLSLAYYDLYFDIIALILLLYKYVISNADGKSAIRSGSSA